MRAKDILGRSDGVLITKYGEIPHLARSNWSLWKLIKNLSKDEIRVLISNKIKLLKSAKSDEEIKNLRRDIVLLSDAYKIKNRYPYIDLDKTEAEILQILNFLGFKQTFYKNEALNLLSKLIRYDKIFNNIPVYVVIIVLDHYDVDYIFDDILNFLNDEDGINLKNIKEWCDKYYWSK